jgi:hypothetical protein
MKRFFRWTVAALVTVIAFVTATWAGGALVLPSVMKDPGVRWSVASGLGVAVAALAALWGHGFANTTEAEGSKPPPSGRVVEASGSGAVAIGQDNRASIITGSVRLGSTPAASGKPVGPPHRSDAADSSVTASGEHSIAIGRDNTGPLATGSRAEDRQP